TLLTKEQAERLFQVLLNGDGHERPHSQEKVWYQDDLLRRDWFQSLAGMLGVRSRSYTNIRGNGVVDLYHRNTILVEHTRSVELFYKGKVWCPTVGTGIWFARRRGNTYWTGNSPTTVVTGAKLKDLERGANRVWGLPSGATAQNLQLVGDLAASVNHWKMLKESMMELMGVPEQSMGKSQNLGNVSGVALAIQYLPLMEKRTVKTLTYGLGLRLINRLIIKITAIADSGFGKKMDELEGNPYRNEVVFPNPMPQDEAIELEKARARLDMNLSTKRKELEKMGYSQAEIETIIHGALDELQEESEAMFDADLDKPGIGAGKNQNMRGGVPEVRAQKVSSTAAKKANFGET
ncbi:MAG: phage portal protein, partial [Candidatus Hermodarchaeia archaeon]